MPDLTDQIRAYYEATTKPSDIDAIVVDSGTVLVGAFPDATQRRSDMKTVPRSTEINRPTRPWWRGPRAALTALLATVVVVAAVFAVVRIGTDDDVAAPASDPAAVVEAYRVALNNRDYDAMRALLAEDVVFAGHPIRPDEPARGIADVMVMERTGLSFAAPVNANEFYEVEVDGNTVTLSVRFHTESGGCIGHSGQRVVVEDGKIASWDWGADAPCE